MAFSIVGAVFSTLLFSLGLTWTLIRLSVRKYDNTVLLSWIYNFMTFYAFTCFIIQRFTAAKMEWFFKVNLWFFHQAQKYGVWKAFVSFDKIRRFYCLHSAWRHSPSGLIQKVYARIMKTLPVSLIDNINQAVGTVAYFLF